ncbi:MAG: AMP-binding protein, partial [Myxococcota bacterium]|nr:AMP-binding protein [Myxococcota bacterium]MEC8425288.1 AMP-binding protein [Myxococcota bacterium]
MATIPSLFVRRITQAPDAPAFCIRSGDDQAGLGRPSAAHPGWTMYTLRDFGRHVSGLVRRLYALGVGPGVPVALVAETSHMWAAVDLAVLALRGVTVGIHPSLTGR